MIGHHLYWRDHDTKAPPPWSQLRRLWLQIRSLTQNVVIWYLPSIDCRQCLSCSTCRGSSQVSLLSVDEMYDSLPLVERDMYWNESEPQPPYTTASAEHRKPSFMGSALDIRFSYVFISCQIENTEILCHVTMCVMWTSVPKEEMEFQSNLEQIKEHEEANYSTPLLGGLGRLLGVQSPNFPRSTRVSLLRRRPGAPLSRFPLYLHPEAPSTPGQVRQPLNQERDPDYAFSSMPLYERSGFYSCPQTPIHCVPPAVSRPRPARRAPNEWNRSCSSLAHAMAGSQLLPPDTPGHVPQPPSSAFPWLSEDGESAPTFSFPDPPPELCPISKLRPGQGLLSRRPPPPRLNLEYLPMSDSQPGPASARAAGSGGERVFSFNSPPRTAAVNPSNPNSSSSSINATSTNSAGTTGSLCNGTSHTNFSNHGNFSASTRASNGGNNGGLSSNMNPVSTSASSQQEANQQHSPNDSGISLAEGDLLGVLVDGGVKKAAGGREQDWEKTVWRCFCITCGI